jgi:hypothetical protein
MRCDALNSRVAPGAQAATLVQIVIAPVSIFSARSSFEKPAAPRSMDEIHARTARLGAAPFPYRSTPY